MIEAFAIAHRRGLATILALAPALAVGAAGAQPVTAAPAAQAQPVAAPVAQAQPVAAPVAQAQRLAAPAVQVQPAAAPVAQAQLTPPAAQTPPAPRTQPLTAPPPATLPPPNPPPPAERPTGTPINVEPSAAPVALPTDAAPLPKAPAGGPKPEPGGGEVAAKPARASAHWYDKLRIRGYTQLRYNRLLVSNDDFVNVQADRSIGKSNGFFLRRARIIISGDVHERVSVYLQTDAANGVGDLTHVVAMRDFYADVALDGRKEARFRIGQSKVPFGFENMQSSQNRAPLDRSDAINSGAPNERDLGVFFYWAPAEVRARFKHLVDSGLKGSGDYGVVALGAYNGQGTNVRERNDNLHVVARATYPFVFGDQIVEVGAGGYAGKYVVNKSEDTGGPEAFRDARAHVALTLYPQPIGFQAEYNVGVGPELDASRGLVREGRPHGGYAMVLLRLGHFVPYVRALTYDGGKKQETDAIKYKAREVEAGLEWHVFDALELTAAFARGSRTAPRAPYTFETGHLLRLQAQFNY